MKISCDIIKDLLPLYCDNMCSNDSRVVIDEHLTECESCGEELKKMLDNSDAAVLRQEKNSINSIIGKYRKNLWKKMLFFLSCVLLFPNIVMFAGCHELCIPFVMHTNLPDIFCLTMCIMLSGVYIPAVVKNRRREWIILSSLICPLLFALTCCVLYGLNSLFSVYTIIPAAAYLLISAALIPKKLKSKPLEAEGYKKDSLKMMIISTAVIPSAGVSNVLSNMSENIGDAFKPLWIVALFTAFVWSLFAVYRFVRLNNISKWGICAILTGLFLSSYAEIEDIVKGKLSSEVKAFWGTDFFTGYKGYSASTANTCMIVLIISVVIGLILLICGGIFSKKQKEK